MAPESKRDPFESEARDEALAGPKIKVVGVGGGGANAVARTMNEGLLGVEFHIVDTDIRALHSSPVSKRLRIGAKITYGLGAGLDPTVGRQAALEDVEGIVEILEGADMVFITAGLGGGTGTGAAPVIASLAKEMNVLTVAVVTEPFGFEGPRRREQAEEGLSSLADIVDTLILIPNDKLLELVPRGASLLETFRMADDVLRQAVQGVADIITTPGVVGQDFSDIRSGLLGMGYARMGTARAKGDNAAVLAAGQAVRCPLLEERGVKGARGILVNIMGSNQLGMHEVSQACAVIRSAAENDDVRLDFGVVANQAMGDEVKVTVVATGYERPARGHTGIPRRPIPAGAPVLPADEPQGTAGLDTPAFLRRGRGPEEEAGPTREGAAPATRPLMERPASTDQVESSPRELFHCSAFYPEKVGPGEIGKLVACVHLPAVADRAVSEASQRLGLPAGVAMRAASETAPARLSREMVVDITPDIPGLLFETQRASLALWQDTQSVEFRFRPQATAIATACRGWVHFWLGGVALADVAVTIFVAGDAVPEVFRTALARANARPYRLVFPSYSHEDAVIVERLEAYAAAFGDEYLHDASRLRAGQHWSDELKRFIHRADVFQLFWSQNAATSHHVEQEWRHALSEREIRADPFFLRPVYWTAEPAPIPPELRPLHFARVPLGQV
jgi:cell division protein FtsZ